jgi:hypothetical protein
MHWNHKTFNHLVGRRSFSHSAFVMAPRLLLQSGSDFLSLPFFQFPAQKNNKLILMNWKNKDKKTAAAYEMENHSGWRGDSRFLATPARIFHTKLFIFPFDSSPHVFLSLCRLLKVFFVATTMLKQALGEATAMAFKSKTLWLLRHCQNDSKLSFAPLWNDYLPLRAPINPCR